ncbi:threonine/serine exporter family protein [Vibrio sp.]|nr:threonine/serine exporter family protein [Vibrio sp.]
MNPQIDKVVAMGEALQRSGCPPYKVEKYTQLYAEQRDIEVIVQATPTVVNYQFPQENNSVVMTRPKPRSINLGLLANTIYKVNHADVIDPNDSKRYSWWIVALANMSIPAAYLMLVGSTLEATLIAFLMGLMVWGIQMLCREKRSIAVEFLSAFVTGIIVSWLASTGLPIPVWALCIASIVLFVPGLTIANSLECLAFNDLVSGTSLLGQCALSLMQLFVGIAMGLNVGEYLWTVNYTTTYINEIPTWLHVFGLILISISIGVVFNARLKDMMLSLPVAILGMWGPLYIGSGWVVGTWATTVLITFYGTWIAKRTGLTGSIYILQGIIILVPGSRVLVSAGQSAFEQSILPIPSIGLSALLMFSAIVAGQVTAYALYSPKIDKSFLQ